MAAEKERGGRWKKTMGEMGRERENDRGDGKKEKSWLCVGQGT